MRLIQAVTLLLLASVSAAQVIDVAAIRENTGAPASFDNLRTMRVEAGRLYVNNMELERLVAAAFGVSERFVIGWPTSRLKAARFDIQATLLAAAPRERVLRELLTTRFGLQAHIEQRPADVYRLTVERPERVRAWPAVCEDAGSASSAVDAAGHPLCRSRSYLVDKRRGLHFAGTMREFVTILGTIVRDRQIVDATNLPGRYVFDFTYGPQSYGDAGHHVPSVLREQVGLRLVPATLPVDVVVIDRVEMPTPN